MKILFINSSHSDYLQDVVFSGLIKTLGSKDITHWPFNPKFIFPFKAYPKNMAQHPEAWKTPSVFLPDPKRYDVVMVASCKPDTFKNYLKIASKIPTSTRVVFLDGGDRPELGGDLSRMNHEHLWHQALTIRPFDKIFKREYFPEQPYEPHILPLPFGYNMDKVPQLSHQKKYQVSFWAVESHPIRTQALQLIKDQFDCEENGTSLNQKFSLYKRKGDYYLQELNACKIVLNFRGGGWDTLRYWETPAVSTLMISQKPQIHIEHNFEHEKHIIFCQDDLSDLWDLCKFYLKNDTLREKIQSQGHRHLLQYHTDTARAENVLRNL